MMVNVGKYTIHGCYGSSTLSQTQHIYQQLRGEKSGNAIWRTIYPRLLPKKFLTCFLVDSCKLFYTPEN